jgi:hypothetical protein
MAAAHHRSMAMSQSNVRRKQACHFLLLCAHSGIAIRTGFSSSYAASGRTSISIWHGQSLEGAETQPGCQFTFDLIVGERIYNI